MWLEQLESDTKPLNCIKMTYYTCGNLLVGYIFYRMEKLFSLVEKYINKHYNKKSHAQHRHTQTK